MASKYRKKFELPENFYEILESYSREVLRDQPLDIIEFSYMYFKALEEVSQPSMLPAKASNRTSIMHTSLFHVMAMQKILRRFHSTIQSSSYSR